MSFYKGPNGVLHAMFWALMRLLSCFSMDLQYVCCAQGGVRIPSALGFREGMEGPLTPWQRTLPSGNLEVLGPLFFLQTALANVSLIWLLAQPVGDITFCATQLST